MFKFIRRYQKWLLVVFCAMLMFAFLVQPVMTIFFPDPSKRTIGTIYDGQKVTQNQKREAINNLAMLRQFGFPGVGLYPQEENEADQGLAWLLMVRAGEHAGFTASDSEAFSALSMRQPEIDSTEALDAFAAKKNITRERLLGVVKQYLIAVQYRQLVQGASYRIEEGYSASPGLAQVRREAEVLGAIGSQQFQQQLMIDFYTRYQRVPNQNEMQLLTATFLYNQLTGRPRVSDNAIRQSVQAEQTRAGGVLVVFDAEPSTLVPSEEKLQELFEQYRGDFAGQGETYGFGYRQPGRVRIEGLRVPHDQALALAAEQVSMADVRQFYEDNADLYADWQPRDAEPEVEVEPEVEPGGEATQDPGEDSDPDPGSDTGEPSTDDTQPGDAGGDAAADDSADDATDTGDAAEPEATTDDAPDAEPSVGDRVRIDFRLRREIRQVLILQKAQELQNDVLADALRMLNEDARVLDERDGFKILPADFSPTPLAEIASRIEEDHGITLEVIEDNGEWVSLPTFTNTLRFVGQMASWMPTNSVWLPDRSGFYLQEQQLNTVELSGRLGLLSSFTAQQASLQQYVRLAKELAPVGPASMPNQPQVGLVIPAATADLSGSYYISRLTAAERDRPAESLAQVREQVVEDAQALAGYETLIGRKDALLERARENTIYDLASLGTEHTLSDFSRSRPPAIEGLSGFGVRTLVDAVFELADQLRAGAGVDGTPSSGRLLAVELPGQRKLLVFVLNTYRPMSQPSYQAMLNAPQGDIVTSVALSRAVPAGTNPIEALQGTLTLEAMIRHTGFEYAEDEGPSNEGAGDGSDNG